MSQQQFSFLKQIVSACWVHGPVLVSVLRHNRHSPTLEQNGRKGQMMDGNDRTETGKLKVPGDWCCRNWEGVWSFCTGGKLENQRRHMEELKFELSLQ